MPISKTVIVPGTIAAALVVGGVGGSLLNTIAADAATTSPSPSASPSDDSQPDRSHGGHTANGITETLLTGDTAAKVTAAAKAAEPDATIERVETDAEGAAYEAHMTKADGSEITLKFDASYKVTGTETGHGGPR
jgi:hypothetical protein